MFGWLKFVGLAGNFASELLPSLASMQLACHAGETVTDRDGLTMNEEDG